MTSGHNVHLGSSPSQYADEIVVACVEHNFQTRESLLDGSERLGPAPTRSSHHRRPVNGPSPKAPCDISSKKRQKGETVMSCCEINSQEPLSCPGAHTGGRALTQVLGAAGLLVLATATPGTVARGAGAEPWITTWAATPAPRWAEELPV